MGKRACGVRMSIASGCGWALSAILLASLTMFGIGDGSKAPEAGAKACNARAKASQQQQQVQVKKSWRNAVTA